VENPTMAQSLNDTSSLKHDSPPTLQYVVELIEERDRLRQRIAVLLEALQDFEAYLDNKADVIDGDYGQPRNNRELALLGVVQCAILKASGGK